MTTIAATSVVPSTSRRLAATYAATTSATAPDDERDGNAPYKLRPPASPASPATPPSSVKVRTPPKCALGAGGVAGTLALDADGGAAQRGDDETGDGGQVGHGVLERAGARTNPDRAGRKRRRSRQMTGAREEG